MMKIIKKIVNFLRHNKSVLITFMLATFVINYIYHSNSVTPYGDKSLLCIDFYHQYGPMMYEFWHRIRTGSGLVYSFYQGLGLPFFRNFLNYLSSPFNIFLLFFNKEGILKALSLIIGIKPVIAACTMTYYLKKKFNKDSYIFIAIGLLFGFCAYYRAYYWNLMWLDGMIWLPIIVLGIENIVNQKKWRLYTISLAIMIFSNYFIGYMICVFSVAYFILYYICKRDFKKHKFKENFNDLVEKGFMFGGASILAAMLISILMIPMASSMLSISATGDSMPTSQYYNFELVDFFKAHLSVVDNVTFKSDPVNSPNVSTGIISIFLFLSFMCNTNITRKRRICYTLLYVFCLSMFFIPQFDFIMHAMHVPNDLPYRYSFIYSFVFLTLGAYAFVNIDKEHYIKLLLEFFITVGFVLVSMTETWANITNNMLIVNIIILTLFFLFLSLSIFFPMYKGIFLFSLALVAVIDVVESTNYAWNITQVEENFIETTKDFDEVISYIHKIDDSKFYRVEAYNSHTLNDASKSYYNGITSFSSMAYESLAKLQKYLGLDGNNINSYEYSPQTPIYDLMFDIKYIIGNTNDEIRYKILDSNTTRTVSKNLYTAGLAFGVDKSLVNWTYTLDDPIEVQNDFVYKSSGINNIFEKPTPVSEKELVEESIKTVEYKYENTNDNYFFSWNSSSISFVLVGDTLYSKDDNYQKLNHLTYSSVNSYEGSQIISAKTTDKYLSVIVGYNYYVPDMLNIYKFNNDKFKDYYQKVLNNSLTITEYKENYIKGQMSVDKNQIIYTSIPYDEGWSVYIDGKKTDTFAIGDSLLAFNAKQGIHTVELKYTIKYFDIGSVVTVLGIILYIFPSINKKYKLTSKLFKRKKA